MSKFNFEWCPRTASSCSIHPWTLFCARTPPWRVIIKNPPECSVRSFLSFSERAPASPCRGRPGLRIGRKVASCNPLLALYKRLPIDESRDAPPSDGAARPSDSLSSFGLALLLRRPPGKGAGPGGRRRRTKLPERPRQGRRRQGYANNPARPARAASQSPRSATGGHCRHVTRLVLVGYVVVLVLVPPADCAPAGGLTRTAIIAFGSSQTTTGAAWGGSLLLCPSPSGGLRPGGRLLPTSSLPPQQPPADGLVRPPGSLR